MRSILTDMNLIFLALTVLAILYTILVMANIIATWVPGLIQGRAMRFIDTLTRPWLDLFRHIRFLRIGSMDFSVIPALLVLQMCIQVFYSLYWSSLLTLGMVLALLVRMVFSSVQSIVIVFLVLAAIRVVGIFAGAPSVGRLWLTLDHILQPVVFPLSARLSPHRSLPYGTALAIFAGVLFASWLILGLVGAGLEALCFLIPL